ncbi:MAG: DUF1338 domain-containing protein [Vulcanimicrobiaceae bacterium]
MNVIATVLERAERRYRAATPSVEALRRTLLAAGALEPPGDFANDHVAFRTFGVPGLGIASLDRALRASGYERRDDFRFDAKHLDATWYAPPATYLPRIFVSELRVDDLSARARTIVASYADAAAREAARSCDPTDADAVDAFLCATPWPKPTYAAYRTLLDESEYAAWVLAFGYALNHQTFSVQALRGGFDTLEPLVTLLERTGHRLAAGGGTIKTSPDGLLRQSSTRADPVEYRFACGVTERIAGAYVEFAERGVLPAFANVPRERLLAEHRRDGFETANADRIFESTDR